MTSSYVEKVLPLIQRSEWAIYRQNSDGRGEKGSFINIIKFLIHENNAIEYMTDDLRCWIHNVDDHEIQNCNALKTMDLNSRMEAVRNQFACFNCLTPGHVASRCFNKTPFNEMNTDNRICGRLHHSLLHNDLKHILSFQNMATRQEN